MHNKKQMKNMLYGIISLACVLIVIMPISILVYGSFQGGGISNYIQILTQYHIQTYFRNSLIVSVISVTAITLLDIYAGFAFSKMNFPMKNALYLFLLSALLLPGAAIMFPVFQLTNKLHLLNTYLAILGPYVVTVAPFNLLTVKNGFDSTPNTVLEAAMIDGAKINTLLWKVAIPMNRPAIIMTIIWSFLSSWNEYLFAFLLLRKEEIMTITVIPTKFQSMYGGKMGMLYASLFIILIPSILIYFVFQKFIVSGLNAGAVKE